MLWLQAAFQSLGTIGAFLPFSSFAAASLMERNRQILQAAKFGDQVIIFATYESFALLVFLSFMVTLVWIDVGITSMRETILQR